MPRFKVLKKQLTNKLVHFVVEPGTEQSESKIGKELNGFKFSTIRGASQVQTYFSNRQTRALKCSLSPDRHVRVAKPLCFSKPKTLLMAKVGVAGGM